MIKRLLSLMDIIGSRLVGEELTTIELKRVERELKKLDQRITSKQFKIYSFCDNTLNIPERMNDFFGEIEFYSKIGKSLSTLFQAIDINQYRKILDIAPGYAPKVELGLYYSNYNGLLTILDQDEAALQKLRIFMDLFNIKYESNFRKLALEQLGANNFDLIVGNHMIDDIVCNYYCRANNINLSDIYEDENLPKSIWREIIGSFDYYQDLYLNLLFEQFYSIVPSKAVLLSLQYPSYFENSLGLKEVSNFNITLNQKLQQRLLASGFTELSVPSTGYSEVVQPEYLLAVKRK